MPVMSSEQAAAAAAGGVELNARLDVLARDISQQLDAMRSEMCSSLRDVEARQQLATDTHRHENQKLLAEILTAGSTLSQQLRVFPFLRHAAP